MIYLDNGKEKRLTGSNIIAALSIGVFVITFAVVLTLFFRPGYHLYLHATELAEDIDIDEEVLLDNYNALIDYNSVFDREPLEFPNYEITEYVRIHFAEVKNIFVFCQIAMSISFLVSLGFFLVKIRKKERFFLRLAGIICGSVPIVIAAIFLIIGWDRVFVLFHVIMFDNDYWIFDVNIDPVIEILPEGFFLQCAIVIVALIFILSFLLIFFSRNPRRKKSTDLRETVEAGL